MAENDISIQRNLDQIKQGISEIGTASKAIDKDLRAVQAGLKLDPSNTELLAQKQALLAQKLANSKAQSIELSAAIAELNRLKDKNGHLTDGQAKSLDKYEQQLKNTTIQVTALTGVTQKQSETSKIAEDSTKSFSQSMTEFQSNLRAVQQVMGGVIKGFELLGGDNNSAMGQMLQQGQKTVQMMSGIVSMNKLLGQSNTALSKTFGTLALSAGAAIGAYSLGVSVINIFGEENRKIAGIIALTTAAVGGLAIAGLAAAGTLTWGTAVPAIMAAVGVGAAGLTALLKKETDNLNEAAIKFDTTNTSTISTPTVPTSSNSGVVSSSAVTIDYKRIEQAITNVLGSGKFVWAVREGIYGGDLLLSTISTGTARGLNIQSLVVKLAPELRKEERRLGIT